MTREERKIYQIGVLVAAALIIMMVIVLTEGCAKNTVYAAQECAVEEIMAEAATEPEIGQIRDSAMPCDDPDGFAAWYSTYTEQEETQDESPAGKEARLDVRRADLEESRTAPETSTEAAAEVETTGPAIYRIGGETIEEGIQVRLYQHLQEVGIGYWYEGALCQMFQESHGKQYAENKNGLDKGIYQYRITYWDWNSGDIFDVDVQMRKYAAEMAARFSSGLSTEEAISRHKTSDWCSTVDWTYVQQVKQWFGQMEVVE